MLHPGADWTVANLILRQGTRREVDSYSALRENHLGQGDHLNGGTTESV